MQRSSWGRAHERAMTLQYRTLGLEATDARDVARTCCRGDSAQAGGPFWWASELTKGRTILTKTWPKDCPPRSSRERQIPGSPNQPPAKMSRSEKLKRLKEYEKKEDGREGDRRLANRLTPQVATAADNVGCEPPQPTMGLRRFGPRRNQREHPDCPQLGHETRWAGGRSWWAQID
jgi:hypothetical protein